MCQLDIPEELQKKMKEKMKTGEYSFKVVNNCFKQDV